MNETSSPLVGVVNAPDVAQALRFMGFKVITAETFRDAATRISTELKVAAFPVVVAESDATGFGPWVTSVATKTRVVVLPTQPDLDLQTGTAVRLDLPATVNDILPLIGFQASMSEYAELLITAGPATQPFEPPVQSPVPPVAGAVPSYEAPAAQVQATPVHEPPTFGATMESADFTALFEISQIEESPLVAPAADEGDIPSGLFDEFEAAPVFKPSSVAEPVFASYVPPAAVSFDEPVYEVDTEPVSVDSFGALFGDTVGTRPAEPEPVASSFYETPSNPVYAAPADTGPVYETPAPVDVALAASAGRDGATATSYVDMFDERAARAAQAARAAEAERLAEAERAAEAARVAQAERAAAPINVAPSASTTTIRATAPSGPRAPLLIVYAGKGGVGKTSQTIMAAKTAADAGLRVVLIDGNRGQADIGTFLRLPKAGLATIYSAVRSSDPADAILLPTVYNRHRPPVSEPLDFAVVLGPPAEHAHPSNVSAAAYAAVIDYARATADLVILDTQIAEAHRTDLYDDLIIPAMRSGAWSVAIVNESRAGADNLFDRLVEFSEFGVSSDHSMILASMYEEFVDFDRTAIERKYGAYGTFIGSAGLDQRIKDEMNQGNFLTTSRAIAPATNAILYRVTGDERFAPAAGPAHGAGDAKRRWFGGKKNASR